MQLASKMRFVSAQLIAILTDDLYLRSRATRTRWPPGCATLVDGGCPRPDDHAADAVERRLRDSSARRRGPASGAFRFYDWDPATGEVRWMCAFDTTEADVDAFAAALHEELLPSRID